MNKHYIFSPFSEMQENVLDVRQWPAPTPSRPFHVVVAPGQAREGNKHTKQVLHPPELHYPLKPHHQMPGPIPTSQTYLQTLVLECWMPNSGAVTRHVKRKSLNTCKVLQLTKFSRWHAEKKKCEEARKVQPLEILLVSYGITTLV
ncbi:hypothetical protein BDR07DRAFT_1385587 [Suillus spraguei]|nr:hypothetical protein BDR07DRAFT_1385587 [Suillus spraguei]